MKKTFVAITIAVLTLFSCQEEDSNILQGDDLMKKIKEEMNDVPVDVQEETGKEEVILLDVIPEKALPKAYQLIFDSIKEISLNKNFTESNEKTILETKKSGLVINDFWDQESDGDFVQFDIVSLDSLIAVNFSFEFDTQTKKYRRMRCSFRKFPSEIRDDLTHNLNAFLTKLTNVKGTQFSLGEPDWQEKGLVYDNSTTENIDQSVLVKWEGDRSHKIEFYRCFDEKFIEDKFLIKE